jgi:dienelactone hydrolase
MKASLSPLVLTLTLATAALQPAEAKNPGPAGSPRDSRQSRPKDYNGYFPWTPPTDLATWRKRRQELREQVLVATGLWPMPAKTPLHPVIHGKIERNGYTVEKIFFASYPGFYVTGSLYRPRSAHGTLAARKYAGVLCPHGHWANGRFYEASDGEADDQIKHGAEKTKAGAKYPLQARCAQLARMGCVVFHYDMVGYADSTQIPHREGFKDAEAELRQQNFMSLQTWNSIRALDFLLTLPEVDPARIGVTGASGGGTQTFILCAVDDRPAVAFPAVMVSTAMQGGCVCENCSYLRLNTSNVELAGLFAPRPLAMSGADDWTLDIENDGLPELKHLYRLYGVEYQVQAHCWPQFGHNYNQVSREFMYRWFNKHLKLGQGGPVREQPFVPIPPKELSVYDAEHPRPGDAVNAEGLGRYLTAEAEKQLEGLFPKDAQGLEDLRRVACPALRVMIQDRLPEAGEVEEMPGQGGKTENGLRVTRLTLSRRGQGEVIPTARISGENPDGTVLVWIHPEGPACLQQDQLNRLAREAVTRHGATVVIPQVFQTGPAKGQREPLAPQPNAGFAGYNYGYNRTLLAERVHDILTAVAYARRLPGAKRVHLVGFGKAGPWVVLARGLCGDAVERTAADQNQFRFEQVKGTDDEMMQPGALKYGGLPVLAALCAPHELYLHNTQGTGSDRWLRAVYQLTGQPDRLRRSEARSTPEEVLSWLLR